MALACEQLLYSKSNVLMEVIKYKGYLGQLAIDKDLASSKWKSQYQIDMKSVADEYGVDQTNNQFCKTLLKKLDKKYWWRQWLTVVYKNTPGVETWHHHWKWDKGTTTTKCSGRILFELHDKNIVVSSVEKPSYWYAGRETRVWVNKQHLTSCDVSAWHRLWTKELVKRQHYTCIKLVIEDDRNVAVQFSDGANCDIGVVRTNCALSKGSFVVILFGYGGRNDGKTCTKKSCAPYLSDSLNCLIVTTAFLTLNHFFI